MFAPEAFSELEASLATYLPLESITSIREAYEFAAEAHKHQRRRSGEPYIIHPIAVAKIISDLKLDQASIVAALLHDTVEDTHVTLDEIRDKFSEQVAELVDGLTKISKVEFRSTQEKMAENFRKMILAMAKDLRVILIKLADRLHNMRTMGSMPKPKALKIAKETLDIYAPLANRLGIFEIKSELEDICLRVLKEDIYLSIREKIAAKKTERDRYIAEVKGILETELKKYKFEAAEVYGRPKHFYSIYKKMMHRGVEYEDIHDLFAFRIIVNSIKECYEALGIVHAMWKPMPGRFKDYIAMPKGNMYQSLHTTVIRPNGAPAEIQIRTREMHSVCEFGVAAHWAYKENEQKIAGTDVEKFSWLRRIVQWQSELKDPDEFLEAVKVDLFDEEIFVFTPQGDVISLPTKSTALDFAFTVHTDIGLRTIGAKVNSLMVPIKKTLKSGDIVEILTSEHQRPKQDWLNFVITSKAKNKIRSALRGSQREKSKSIGFETLEQELLNLGLSIAAIQKRGDEEVLVKAARESKLDDVLIAIGYGKINCKELVQKVFGSKDKLAREDISDIEISEKPKTKSSEGILVSGIDNVMVHFAKCCNPLPGESITGFITRGKGVTIHRSDCYRAHNLDPGRKVEVSWGSGKGVYSTFVRILTHDKLGVLADVTQVMMACGVSVLNAEVRTGSTRKGELDFELGIRSRVQLEDLVRKLEKLDSVLKVERKSSNMVKGGIL